MHQLNIRLSYHDMKMFQQMLESIPKQREVARKPSVSKEKKQPANFQGMYFLYTSKRKYGYCNFYIFVEMFSLEKWLTQQCWVSEITQHHKL